MTTLTIDTLAYAKRLRAAGIDDRQAEAMAEALAAGISETGAELATKADLANLARREDLAELKAELTNRIYLVAGLIVAAVFAMLRFMA